MAESKPARASKPRRKLGKKLALGALILFVVVGLLGLGGVGILYATTALPDPNEDFTTNTTFIYYEDGDEQMGSLAVQNRVTLDYEEMPQHMKDATVAAENRTFWEDPGFSARGMARGVRSIVTGGELQGGSTITQQYIKILYLDSSRSMTRKARELVLAVKMGRELPKEEILEGYLNTIYFGRGAYGIEAAAKSYFLKKGADLTLQESAVLAAILNNPAGYNPSGGEDNVERLTGRYNYVLDGMLSMDTITQEEHDEIYGSLPEFPEVPVNDRYGGAKGFLIKKVERELVDLGFSEEEIYGGGLNVTTTVSESLQDSAVEIVEKYNKEAAENASEPQDPKELHIALSAVDTRTGGILAYYGGPDYVENSRDWANQPRPAASAFKPFAALAGLRNGFTLESVFNGDTFTPRGESKPVRNQFHQQYGRVTLRKSIADSINTSFVDMTQQMSNGPEEVIRAANDAGAPTDAGWDPNNRIALGAAEVSPLNMANSFATLADSGQYKDTHIIEKVEDSRGSVLFEAKPELKQQVDPNDAANVTSALTNVIEEGTGQRAANLGWPAAGKTGTHGVDDTIASAWFVGYTRQISTAVMYVAGDSGTEDLGPYKRPSDSTFYGSSYPLMTWLDFMSEAMEGMDVEEFDTPTQPEVTEEATPQETTEPEPTPSETEPEPEPEETTEEPEETTEEPTPSEPETEEPATEAPPTREEPPTEEADSGDGGSDSGPPARNRQRPGQGQGADQGTQQDSGQGGAHLSGGRGSR